MLMSLECTEEMRPILQELQWKEIFLPLTFARPDRSCHNLAKLCR